MAERCQAHSRQGQLKALSDMYWRGIMGECEECEIGGIHDLRKY